MWKKNVEEIINFTVIIKEKEIDNIKQNTHNLQNHAISFVEDQDQDNKFPKKVDSSEFDFGEMQKEHNNNNEKDNL